jgi:hypothetical protein
VSYSGFFIETWAHYSSPIGDWEGCWLRIRMKEKAADSNKTTMDREANKIRRQAQSERCGCQNAQRIGKRKGSYPFAYKLRQVGERVNTYDQERLSKLSYSPFDPSKIPCDMIGRNNQRPALLRTFNWSNCRDVSQKSIALKHFWHSVSQRAEPFLSNPHLKSPGGSSHGQFLANCSDH